MAWYQMKVGLPVLYTWPALMDFHLLIGSIIIIIFPLILEGKGGREFLLDKTKPVENKFIPPMTRFPILQDRPLHFKETP